MHRPKNAVCACAWCRMAIIYQTQTSPSTVTVGTSTVSSQAASFPNDANDDPESVDSVFSESVREEDSEEFSNEDATSDLCTLCLL